MNTNTDNTANTLVWSDRQGARDRFAWLLLVKGGQIHVFGGETIPNVCIVTRAAYHKNGKWSHTTSTIQLAKGVHPIPGMNGWGTGTFREGLESATGVQLHSWLDVANALGVGLSEAQAFLRKKSPRCAEHFDAIGEAWESMEDAEDGEPVELALSFGSPTNRVSAAGFWEWPVQVLLDGEVIDTLPASSYQSTTGAAKVLNVEKSSGYHGGTVSLRVLAPEGAKLDHSDPALERR